MSVFTDEEIEYLNSQILGRPDCRLPEGLVWSFCTLGDP